VKIDYGVVEHAANRQLTAYREKPVIPYAVSMGINTITRDALSYVPPKGKFDMPDLMLALQRAGRRVLCYPTQCYWQDIGRFDDYQRASDDFSRNPTRFLPRGASRGKSKRAAE
jgi:NDP-sugar pyrophosphorylase family protein